METIRGPKTLETLGTPMRSSDNSEDMILTDIESNGMCSDVKKYLEVKRK